MVNNQSYKHTSQFRLECIRLFRISFFRRFMDHNVPLIDKNWSWPFAARFPCNLKGFAEGDHSEFSGLLCANVLRFDKKMQRRCRDNPQLGAIQLSQMRPYKPIKGESHIHTPEITEKRQKSQKRIYKKTQNEIINSKGV